MNAAITLLGLVGATLIVVRGVIFHPIRRLAPTFFGCSQCFGMWLGAAAGAAGLLPTGHLRAVDAFLVGAATSLLSLLADAVLLRLLGDPNEGHEP